MATQDEKGYNGWTNYATWGVNLLITNESWDTTLEAVLMARRGTPVLKEWFQDTFLTDHTTDEYCYGNIAVMQLVESALCEVNWYEIAEHLVTDYADDIVDEDADEDAELGSEGE